jgi:hypothetical protein
MLGGLDDQFAGRRTEVRCGLSSWLHGLISHSHAEEAWIDGGWVPVVGFLGQLGRPLKDAKVSPGRKKPGGQRQYDLNSRSRCWWMTSFHASWVQLARIQVPGRICHCLHVGVAARD